jgi:protein-tyrosine phosphatase
MMRKLVSEAGLDGEIELDSAGTGAWHVGSRPDARATAAARARGITLEGRARQVAPTDFQDYDLVLAMDRANRRELGDLARDEAEASKVHLLTEFDPSIAEGEEVDVPDPYYGGEDGFEEVLDLVQASCEGLLEQISAGAVR